jgi:hypothetical protein
MLPEKAEATDMSMVRLVNMPSYKTTISLIQKLYPVTLSSIRMFTYMEKHKQSVDMWFYQLKSSFLSR